MNAKLYRVILPVEDIEEAKVFYAHIFKQEGMRVSPGRHYFKLGETILACYDPRADGDEIGDWKLHENQYIYIAVQDLEHIRSELKSLAYQSIGKIEKMPWGETLFYTKDPFGNPICFVDEETVFTGKWE